MSEHAPKKDYLEAPLRCARLGARELWVFDPERFGPEVTGGPFPLQIWRLDDDALRMRRTYAGNGPGYSEELGAWLMMTEAPRRLRVAAGPQGPLWPSEAEAEATRADAEARRADAEAARAEAEARRAEAEARRAEDAEDELARLRRRLDAED